jgi:hypothetical protein
MIDMATLTPRLDGIASELVIMDRELAQVEDYANRNGLTPEQLARVKAATRDRISWVEARVAALMKEVDEPAQIAQIAAMKGQVLKLLKDIVAAEKRLGVTPLREGDAGFRAGILIAKGGETP